MTKYIPPISNAKKQLINKNIIIKLMITCLLKMYLSKIVLINSIRSFSIFSVRRSVSDFNLENTFRYSFSFLLSFLMSLMEKHFIELTKNKNIPPIAMKTLFRIISPV